jgi:dynein assembly factor 2
MNTEKKSGLNLPEGMA